MTNPTPSARRAFEDVHLGESVELSPRRVDKDEIITFAKAFDPFPFHLDEAAAKASLLGGLAASGWQTATLTQRMIDDSFLGHLAVCGAIAVRGMKWRKPVLAGDSLSGRAEVASLEAAETDRPATMTLAVTMRNQKDQTVMTLSLVCPLATRQNAAEAAQ